MTSASPFTFNWPFFGNKHIIDFLQGGITASNLAHCYVFSGPRDLGKSTVARHFAISLLCDNFANGRGTLPCGQCLSCRQFAKKNHSDVYYLRKLEDKKNIAIDQVREFIRSLSMGSLMGSYKIGIIAQAESLSIEAANALLKTLEEPKRKALVILLTARLAHLPATI